ncbi:GNAT family N-acetyltransferase [Alkaliphilus transvaalensis]|uniref:GNAT family N-acetyltransferase n=1 Tax=Alkaliphilus transvaalensis TaxID=114628 RepID=UPI000479EC04|nr:GNAT family N-acetyltransferase [Alkaliphilus transvaalensis]
MAKVRLAVASDRDYFIQDYLTRYGKDMEMAKKHAIVCIDVHRSIVIHSEDEIIGSVTWAIREGIQAGLVVIFQMSITKTENRGKGYGGLLVKHCIEDIENFYQSKGYNLRRIFISVNENNIAGRNIYKKNGFRVLAELKDHLKLGEMELIYGKDYF